MRGASEAAVPGAATPAFAGTLLVLFLVVFAVLGIAPRYRQDWMLENALVVVALPLLLVGFRRMRFSRGAYAALFVFGLLHEVGAHYTYAEVPYDAAFRWWSGHSLDAVLGLARNSYDRLVHFSYGLLVTPAVIDLFRLRAPPRGPWRRILPVMFVMGNATFFELVEWGAALVFGGNLGVAYLGTQGDPWDAQQDMLMATLGSVACVNILALAERFGRGRQATPG